MHSFLRLSLGALLGLLAACQSSLPISAPVGSTAKLRAQRNTTLQASVQAPEGIPTPIQTRTQAQAQVYADQVSKRRGIDLFYLHPAPVGLKLQVGQQEAWVLSYPGTSRLRTDLNLELRALVSGNQTALNLNYAGPVTLGRSHTGTETIQPAFLAQETQNSPRSSAEILSFELITGLPGNGVTEAYGEYLENLQRFLRARFQARPFEFDDGPLIYAVHQGAQLLGFVFQNQRNRLILGERKYADVQSMVMVSAEREILGAYTLVGFNPKTSEPSQVPTYRPEDQGRLGTLFIFGEY